MTLQNLGYSLGQVAIHFNPVNGYYGVSSIGQLDTTQLSYPAMALVPSGDMVQRKGYSEYNLTFYVVDRLLTDSANDFDIYSYSVETLKNYFKQLRLLPGIISLTDEPTIRLFNNERGNDRICGAYSTVAICIEDDAPCADWLDPLGNHTPDIKPDGPTPTPIPPAPPAPEPPITYIKATLATEIIPGENYILFEDKNTGNLVRRFPLILPFPENYNSNLQVAQGTTVGRQDDDIEVYGTDVNLVAIFTAQTNSDGLYFESYALYNEEYTDKHKVTLATTHRTNSTRIGVHNTSGNREYLDVNDEGKLYTTAQYSGRNLVIGSVYDEILHKTTVLFSPGDESDHIIYLYRVTEVGTTPYEGTLPLIEP